MYVLVIYSYDELLIGAPLFRTSSIEPEIGRVFLYRNNRVGLNSYSKTAALFLSLCLPISLLPSLYLSLSLKLQPYSD
jgi:hypothetical protein